MTRRKSETSASSDSEGARALRSLDTPLLVEQAVRGDTGAFEALVNRYSPLVISFLYSKTGNLPDAEDLSQEVFLSAFRHLKQLRDHRKFQSWLMRIAKARLADFCRKNARRPIEIHTSEDSREIIDQMPESSPDPRQRAGSRQVQQIILREINTLGEKHRAIVYWRLIRNESSQEVAERLGLSPKAVSMAFFRGLRALRKALEKFDISSSGVK